MLLSCCYGVEGTESTGFHKLVGASVLNNAATLSAFHTIFGWNSDLHPALARNGLVLPGYARMRKVRSKPLCADP